MKKYLWKCESNSCGYEFKAENPNECPKCGGDDIMIVDEGTLPLTDTAKKVFIGILSLSLIGLVYMNWEKIFPDDSGEISITGEVIYNMTVVTEDNYFTIKGVDVEDLGVFVINSLSGDKIYSNGNKFYPCENGSFFIKWDEDVKITGEKKIKNFKLMKPAHKNACAPLALNVESVDISESCIYTIYTNMDNDSNLEVSLNKNRGFKKGKLEWSKKEINTARFFYLRIKNSSQTAKYKIELCKIDNPINDAPIASEVVKSFNLYKSDIKNNRTQFTDMLKRYGTVIEYNGNDLNLMDFCMQLRTKLGDEGASDISFLLLKPNNVFYSSDSKKIIKLKITK